MTIHPDIKNRWPHDHMMEAAWGLMANSYGGDWSKATNEWRKAAEIWRDYYFGIEVVEAYD